MLDVHDGIQTGRYRIAVMGKHHEIVLATALEVICYARKAVLNVTLLAGRDARIFFSRFFHHIKDYARDIGCVQVQAGCGRAQTRLFNRLAGSHSVYSVIRLDV